MKTINELNSGLNTIESVIGKQNANKIVGIVEVVKAINLAMDELTLLGLTNRKAKKAAKEQILNGLDGDTNKSVLRVYGVAFTAHFRGIVLSDAAIKLPLSMLENMLNYATVNDCENYFKDADEDEIKAHLKTLKTRVVSSKTFEKKGK